MNCIICFLDKCACRWNAAERLKFGNIEFENFFKVAKSYNPFRDAIVKSLKIIPHKGMAKDDFLMIGSDVKFAHFHPPIHYDFPRRCFLVPLLKEEAIN